MAHKPEIAEQAALLALTTTMTALVEMLAASGQLKFPAFAMLLQSRADQLRPGQPMAAAIVDQMCQTVARNLDTGMQQATPRGTA